MYLIRAIKKIMKSMQYQSVGFHKFIYFNQHVFIVT